jgi:hypothetical protein
MKENKGQPNKASTCFEGSPAAEMMLKIMGEKGIGSLSEEMMKSLIKKLNEDIEESQYPNKKEI